MRACDEFIGPFRSFGQAIPADLWRCRTEYPVAPHGTAHHYESTREYSEYARRCAAGEFGEGRIYDEFKRAASAETFQKALCIAARACRVALSASGRPNESQSALHSAL